LLTAHRSVGRARRAFLSLQQAAQLSKVAYFKLKSGVIIPD
jgi:hypothetical protein